MLKQVLGGVLFLCLFAAVTLRICQSQAPIVVVSASHTPHPPPAIAPCHNTTLAPSPSSNTSLEPTTSNVSSTPTPTPRPTRPTGHTALLMTNNGFHNTFFAEYQDMLVSHMEITVVASIPEDYHGTVIFYQWVPKGLSLANVWPFVINTEQNSRHGNFYDNIVSALKEYPNLLLVDYSAANLAILLGDPNAVACNFRARTRLLPLFPAQDYVHSNAEPRQYDFGFVGEGSKRRMDKVRECEQMGYSFTRIGGWGQEKVKSFKQVRVLLNIHFAQDYQVFESLRNVVGLAAGAVVLTEASLAPLFSSSLESLIVSAEYPVLCQTLKVIIDAYPFYQKRWASINWTAVQVAARTQVRDVFFGDWAHPVATDDIVFFVNTPT